MGNYIIARNSSLDIDILHDYQDNGWSISNGVAVHDDCNHGSIYNTVFSPIPNMDYTLSVDVLVRTGVLKITIGGIEIPTITNTGKHLFEFRAVNSNPIEFWADGNLTINSFQLNEGLVENKTLVFNQDNKLFVGTRSYTADMMAMFSDEFISFKNGELWLHDKGAINNFYGIKYPSEITFYVNLEPSADKDFYTVKIDGNQPWDVVLETPPREGRRRGQVSRIKRGNFTLEKGIYTADILRDMNDPRFATELEALMRGAEMQGKLMKVTIRNNSSFDFELLKVITEVSKK